MFISISTVNHAADRETPIAQFNQSLKEKGREKVKVAQTVKR